MGTWLNLAQLAPDTFELLRVAPKTWLEGMFFTNSFSFSGFDRPADVYSADWSALEQALRLSYAPDEGADDLDWNTADFGGELPAGMESDPVWRATLGEATLEGYEFSHGAAYWFSAQTVREMAAQLEARHGPVAQEQLRNELAASGIYLDPETTPHLELFARLEQFFARAARHGRVVVGGISDRAPRPQ